MQVHNNNYSESQGGFIIYLLVATSAIQLAWPLPARWSMDTNLRPMTIPQPETTFGESHSLTQHLVAMNLRLVL